MKKNEGPLSENFVAQHTHTKPVHTRLLLHHILSDSRGIETETHVTFFPLLPKTAVGGDERRRATAPRTAPESRCCWPRHALRSQASRSTRLDGRSRGPAWREDDDADAPPHPPRPPPRSARPRCPPLPFDERQQQRHGPVGGLLLTGRRRRLRLLLPRAVSCVVPRGGVLRDADADADARPPPD